MHIALYVGSGLFHSNHNSLIFPETVPKRFRDQFDVKVGFYIMVSKYSLKIYKRNNPKDRLCFFRNVPVRTLWCPLGFGHFRKKNT